MTGQTRADVDTSQNMQSQRWTERQNPSSWRSSINVPSFESQVQKSGVGKGSIHLISILFTPGPCISQFLFRQEDCWKNRNLLSITYIISPVFHWQGSPDSERKRRGQKGQLRWKADQTQKKHILGPRKTPEKKFWYPQRDLRSKQNHKGSKS